MNNNEITFINSDDIIKPKESNTNNYNNQSNKVESDEIVVLPEWDLTPPFDSIDRGDMS